LQKGTIAAVAKKYGLSPRLTGLLFPATASAPSTGTTGTSNGAVATPRTTKDKNSHLTDLEKGATRPVRTPQPGWKGISFGDVVNNLWHFCSVDFGRHYIYVGYNALLPGAENTHKSKPSGQRIWTSLLLCDDGTVISVFERPTMPTPEALERTRFNVLNVFKHLSSLHDQDDAQDALMKVRVRWNEHSAKSSTGYSETEAASLLFYYLFDDWLSTYALIARQEHPYRENLEKMREQMFEAADVSLIQQVHNVGRQLTVLKLMYQGYELIVSRLLHRQRAATQAEIMSMSPADPGRLNNVQTYHETPASQLDQSDLTILNEDSGLSVKLSLSAVVRFERLLDRIRLYALTEIEECLKEKESLVFMVSFFRPVFDQFADALQNFNLVTLKESQAVERLTRTTILLAKATIVFLPISLMTAYFSIQVGNIAEKYSLKTYWLCFLVVSVLSIAFLGAFGFYTHTVEGKTIYRSVTRMILDVFKGKRKTQ
jgi:Mg2+ and Co2+ transporter CorA